jgi:hypothetical protein
VKTRSRPLRFLEDENLSELFGIEIAQIPSPGRRKPRVTRNKRD